MELLDLPNVVLIEIFEYLSYDEVAKKRAVCRRFDQICQDVLNAGFNKVIREHNINFKRIKSLLPRRESERRSHSLARHADILTSIETRISMLSMTYTKYVDLNLCCFIPGRVLDEIIRILRLISSSNKQLRPHEVLQELRDISSMAIEHFDEKIAFQFKKAACTAQDHCLNTLTAKWKAMVPPDLKAQLNEIAKIQNLPPLLSPTSGADSLQFRSVTRQQHQNNATMSQIKKLEDDYRRGLVKIVNMQQVQNNQKQRLSEALNAVTELTMQINELKKRLEDIDVKNRELSANMKQLKSGELSETPVKKATDKDDVLSSTISTAGCSTNLFKRQHTDTKINNDSNDLLPPKKPRV